MKGLAAAHMDGVRRAIEQCYVVHLSEELGMFVPDLRDHDI